MKKRKPKQHRQLPPGMTYALEKLRQKAERVLRKEITYDE